MRYLIVLSIAYILTSCVTPVQTCDDMSNAFVKGSEDSVMMDVAGDGQAMVFLKPMAANTMDVLCVELKPAVDGDTNFCLTKGDMDVCRCASPKGVLARCGTGTALLPKEDPDAKDASN